MSSLTILKRFDFRSTEFRFGLILFLILWIYLIIRACTVFYLHDEIVTKWSYVIHWNPLPNQGSVDANNHFLLTLLAGFFTRLFNSDSMFLMRLGSVLAFPIYFWSIFKLKVLFKQKWNFYALLITLTTTSFIVEYFAFSRGYGLAMAFLVFAIQQMISFFHSGSKLALIGSLFGWVLSVYASLTLLPLSLLGLFLLGAGAIQKKLYVWILPVLLMLTPVMYFINYSLILRDLDKLYYGGTDGFFDNTIHSLTRYIWFTENFLLDAFIAVAMCLVGITSFRRFWKEKNLLDPKLLLSIFLFAGVSSILLQHWLLDVNFPEDRTALYLVVFFFGAFFLMLDELNVHKSAGIVFTILSLVFFGFNFNFTHSLQFNAEHIDVEMVNNIPSEVKGIPPTTAGRWNMENELTRKLNLPFRVYQNGDSDHDTLADYLIYDPTRRPELKRVYNIVHFDKISGQALLQRKKILNRIKSYEADQTILSEVEFQNLRLAELEGPIILRCSGLLEGMTEEKEIFVVFASEDSVSKQQYTYEAVPMIRNKKINKSGNLEFDFSYAMNRLEGANKFAAYLWNQNSDEIKGEIKLEVYTIE